MLTSTSTDFVLLSEKISYLTNSFNWVVGGIGIVITIVIGIIGLVQFFYNKKLIGQEIGDIKKDLNDFTNKTLDEKALSLQSYIESEISSLRDEMESKRRSMSGDIARSYALSCESDMLYATAFNWWLSAAVHYDEIGSSFLSTAIKSAKDCLEKIEDGDGFNIKILWEKMTDNQDYISRLRDKHTAESKLIDDLMMKKASLSETSLPLKV